MSVTHAPAPTYVTAAQSRLGAAKTRARSKINKFNHHAEELGCSFVPFVVETHGALSDHAKGLLTKIAKYAVEAGIFSLSLRYMIAAISICLQKGNAQMLQDACVHARERHINVARFREV